MPDPTDLLTMTAPAITFAGQEARAADMLGDARVAVLGAAEAAPYDASRPSHSADAPAAIRAASQPFALQFGQFDFDVGATLGPGIVDLGDIPTDRTDAAGNGARIERAVRRVLDAGVAPLLLGGDDSVPVPFFRAFAGRGPLTVVQIDAHMDWGDVIRGNPYGYGSTMRRVAEIEGITGMVQVGIRGLGSGTADQFEAARTFGHRPFTAAQVRERGLGPVLEAIPRGADCLLSIDCDGLDPAVLPAVAMPTPGGLDMVEVTALLQGMARRGRIVGCALTELVPALDDRRGLSALVAARIALTAAGLMAGR